MPNARVDPGTSVHVSRQRGSDRYSFYDGGLLYVRKDLGVKHNGGVRYIAAVNDGARKVGDTWYHPLMLPEVNWYRPPRGWVKVRYLQAV